MGDQGLYMEDDEVDCSEHCYHIQTMDEACTAMDEEIKRILNINLEREKVYKRALDIWGEIAQINMVFEEMAELQKELCKYLRGNEPKEQIIRIAEEIADLEIMLEQMKLLFNLHKAVESHKEYKISRLKHRLDEEGEIHE